MDGRSVAGREGGVAPGGLIERLRENGARNRSILEKAGIAASEAPTTECRVCGAREITLFWTPGRRLGRSLWLSCPLCGEGVVRYRLDRNRVEHPRLLAALATTVLLAAFVLSMAAGVLYLHGTPAGNAFFEELRSRIERLVAPLTGGPATLPRRGGGSRSRPSGRAAASWRRGRGPRPGSARPPSPPPGRTPPLPP